MNDNYKYTLSSDEETILGNILFEFSKLSKAEAEEDFLKIWESIDKLYKKALLNAYTQGFLADTIKSFGGKI